MPKKKKSIDYSSQNVIFELEKRREKLMRFNPNLQEVELKCLDDGAKGTHTIAFAHLPKEIKQLIKPLNK